MNYYNVALLLLFLHVFSLTSYSKDYISEDKDRWKEYYKELTPLNKVTSWHLPFDLANRRNLKYLSRISSFGAARNSYKQGHYHTGLDCMPKNCTEPVWVYAMAEGVVCSIHLGQQFKTIVIKHLLNDSSIVFTSYKHINDIKVSVGDPVNKDTKLARVLTKTEARSFGGAYDHLHLEIRKSFEDYGCASWLTMTKDELKYYFFDPYLFMKQMIQ